MIKNTTAKVNQTNYNSNDALNMTLPTLFLSVFNEDEYSKNVVLQIDLSIYYENLRV